MSPSRSFFTLLMIPIPIIILLEIIRCLFVYVVNVIIWLTPTTILIHFMWSIMKTYVYVYPVEIDLIWKLKTE